MEDDIKKNREKRLENMKKKKIYNSDVMKMLREDVDDDPYEIKGHGNLGWEEDEEDKRRRKFEEDHMVRLPVDKRYAKKLRDRKRKLT